MNFVGQLFKADGAVKPWKKLQEEYGNFKWIELINSLPKPLTEQISIDLGYSINFAIHDHHLIQKH